MMYYLFRFHHKFPSEVYWLKPGEKQIVYSFMKYEIEQRIKENSQDE